MKAAVKTGGDIQLDVLGGASSIYVLRVSLCIPIRIDQPASRTTPVRHPLMCLTVESLGKR